MSTSKVLTAKAASIGIGAVRTLLVHASKQERRQQAPAS